MKVTVYFDEKWLGGLREQGVRAVRRVEKWVGATDGLRLVTSGANELVVEMDPAKRPEFVDGLESFVKREFGVEDPACVVSYSGIGKTQAAPPVQVPVDPGSEELSVEKAEVVKPSGRNPADVGKVLDDLLTRVPLCHSLELSTYFRETSEVVPMLKRMDALDSFWRVCPLVSIDVGYGLSDFLHCLGELYCALGLTEELDEKSIREFRVDVGGEHNPYAFWDEAVDIARDMKRINEKGACKRPILCLKIGPWQGKLTSAEVKLRLRRINAFAGSFTLVFTVPFVEPRVLTVSEEALGDIFDVRPVVVPPVQTESLVEYARTELAKRSFRIENSAGEAIEQLILNEKRDDSFFGYKTMEKIVNKMIYSKALCNCRTGDADRTINTADIMPYGAPADAEGDPAEELAGLIGLGEVKRKIEEVVLQIKTQLKMTGRGRRVRRPAIHMLFAGNPGTGKTTVARIVARLLKREGVLRKGHLLEVHGRDLCGEYVGQTAPKTSAICRDAYGSVLFIDEAYSLFRGDGNDRDYGREALDTLIAEMENHRDDLCVILAGYTEDMRTMLDGNEGLRSRIPYTVEFPDYSREELAEIFFSMVRGNFEYEKPLEKAVREFFNALPDEAMKGKGFSNARFVRNLYERTWGKAAYRSRLADGEIKLLVSDLAGATGEREFKQLIEKSVRRPIGFGAWTD